MQLHKRLCPSVHPSVGRSVRDHESKSVRRSIMIELKSGKTRISAPAHPSATDGRVSGLVILNHRHNSLFTSKFSHEEENKEEERGRIHGHQLWTGGQRRICAFSHFSTRADGRTDGQRDGPTDGRTDGRTDRPSYRDAWMHLKR